MTNVILVDTSYTAFYRFFATMKWYSMAFKDEMKLIKTVDNYDWFTNKEFMAKYEKMFLSSIEKIVKKKVFKKSIIIFCRDSPKKKLWRTQISADYKGERLDLSIKNNFKPVFNYTYKTMIPKLVKDNDNMFEIKIAEIEADDVIALSCKYIRNNFDDKIIYLVSGDEDFLQLGDKDLYFANYKKKKLFQLTKEEASEKLRLKLICGDKSDNIKCIYSKEDKLSNKLKKLIKESEEEMDKFLKENKKVETNFNHNKKMIDFNSIPKKYHKKVFDKLKKIF
tara:strand:+ start:4108 stop:4947 length:840 start_codon:yes stop_codon:yes gene_type:complete